MLALTRSAPVRWRAVRLVTDAAAKVRYHCVSVTEWVGSWMKGEDARGRVGVRNEEDVTS